MLGLGRGVDLKPEVCFDRIPNRSSLGWGAEPHFPAASPTRTATHAVLEGISGHLTEAEEFGVYRFPGDSGKIGAPGVSRTPGLLVRSLPRYPTELRARKPFSGAAMAPEIVILPQDTVGPLPFNASVDPAQPAVQNHFKSHMNV